MTPAQVEEQARRRYNAVSATFWSQDEIFKLIYEAEYILATEALVIEQKDAASVSTVDGTQAYAFPSGVIGIKRVEYDGYKLQPINMREDDRLTYSNSTTTTKGTPQYYFVWDDYIYLRPIPDAAKAVTLYEYKEPTLLTTASTTLSVPGRFHTALIDYVCSIMAAKDENLQLADWYNQKWLQHVEGAKKWTAKKKRMDGFATVNCEEALAETLIGVV